LALVHVRNRVYNLAQCLSQASFGESAGSGRPIHGSRDQATQGVIVMAQLLYRPITIPKLLFAIALAGVGVLSGCQSCGTAKSVTLSWGLLDKDTNVETQFPPNSSPYTIPTFSDHYMVSFQAQDPGSIRKLDISGSGTFECYFTDEHNTQFDCGGALPSTPVPANSTTFGSSGTTQGFVMSPPLPDPTTHKFGFALSDIPCPTFQGHACQATHGTLHVTGVETSWSGTQNTSTLDLQAP